MNKKELIKFIKTTWEDQEEAVDEFSECGNVDDMNIAIGWTEACECILRQVKKLK